MKKLFLAILSVCLFTFAAQAQSGKKALKKAQSSLNSYIQTQDQAAKMEKLSEAVSYLEEAMSDSEITASSKVYQLKGELHNAQAQEDLKAKVLNPEAPDNYPNAGIDAYQAFKMAIDKAVKKWETKDALAGLAEAASNINNLGVAAYEAQNYKDAYAAFAAMLDIHDIVVENGGDSPLGTEEDYQNQMYIAGLAALNGDMIDKAEPMFKKLSESGFEKPAIFEAMYKAKLETDPEAALASLEEGRTKFPDDVSLLFAEINHYLKENKLDILVDKLKTAIDKEPDNMSLYLTLGNVYDNLFQKELEAKNMVKADEYFDDALNYYNQALEKQPGFSDAIYSIGALYYNKAAAKTREMNALPISETKKFDAIQKEVNMLFDTALPYFEKAEVNNPEDLNTLIALKEIYAKKNDFEKSNAFKARIEAVQAGETNK